MSQTLYYAELDNEFFGPFALNTIAEMHLTPDVMVLSTASNEWKQAADYPELAYSLDTDIVGEAQYSTGNFQETETDGYDTTDFDEPAPEPQQSDNDCNDRIAGLLTRIRNLIPDGQEKFRRVFTSQEAEQEFHIAEYKRTFGSLLNLVKELGVLCRETVLPKRAMRAITDTVNDTAAEINRRYADMSGDTDRNGTAVATTEITIGKTYFSLPSPLEAIDFFRFDFMTALGERNLCVTYDEASENIALDFTNSIIGKLYSGNPARMIETCIIDTDYMTGIDDAFKLLDRDLYKVVARTDEVRDTLASLQARAGFILRNLLVEKGSTLRDYNSTHENKEANILLVVKNFPHGLTTDNLDTLKRLANAGPKAGIHIVILTPRKYVENMSEREAEAFDWTEFLRLSNHFHFKDRDRNILGVLESNDEEDVMEGDIRFDTLSEAELKEIVRDVNSRCGMKEDVVLSISDYLPDMSLWWKTKSARQIEIPFGLGDDMHIKSLKITQESGQNTAVVIGIPGSGKSVFLHSLICSAAVRYSPDELRMYLIDFSGVEFNSYAIGKLPHARVIAPEAEREFGLSILNELVEEGSRRMSLCREHNVSNIVDLKNVAPDVRIPRLLVIIDEFQKLFETDNDPIAKEANSKIHIIIQEFRKFGINLVLATQKLPTSSFLPRDLIANRVVFKSAPNDFDSLITSENRTGMPRLRTGQCVYNSESGAAYANETVQGFFTSKSEMDRLMEKLRDFAQGFSYDREPMKVFRSADLPVFGERRLEKRHTSSSPIPYAVPVYFGESIAVSDTDVNVELVKENANNILIIGGEAEISRTIAFNAMRSAVAAHTDHTAKVIVLNGLRVDNPLNVRLKEFAAESRCDFTSVSSTADVGAILRSIREEIELRRADETIPQQHIYVTCLDFQSIRALDRDISGSMPRMSAAAKDMDMIIRNGASVGVFVIAQTDTLEALNRVSQSSPLPMFNFRIALQMPEDISYKIIGSPLANKLFVFNRPASRFRGYVRDNARNLSVKFKPYK